MKKIFLYIIFFLLFASVMANILSVLVLDKALHYRDHIRYIEREFPNEGLHLTSSNDIRSANLENLVVFMGGSLVRYWIFPRDFDFHVVNMGGIEEKTATTMYKFKEMVVKMNPDYVLVTAGFCEIHTAVHNRKDVSPIIEKNFAYIQDMVSLAQQSHITPILATLTPVGPRFLFPYLRRGQFSWKNKKAENEAIQKFNHLLRNYARKKKIPLIDFHKALTDANGVLIRRYSIVDGEHVNHEGYAFLSLFLEKNLEAIFHNQKEKYGAGEISS